ncbi:MAG: hypothetical protein KC545_04070 [Nitrospira sp.]|nr:hypothetical protein [Nitrospira sp.]
MKHAWYSQKNGLLPIQAFVGVMTFSFVLVFGSQAGAGEKAAPGPAGSAKPDTTTENLHEQIDDLEAQIQKLREQSLELQERTRLRLKAQIDLLQKQRDSLVPRIERLRDTSETAWQDIKENIQKAIEELKQSVDVMEK